LSSRRKLRHRARPVRHSEATRLALQLPRAHRLPARGQADRRYPERIRLPALRLARSAEAAIEKDPVALVL